jgi:anaphase-promoting complex subunit 4
MVHGFTRHVFEGRFTPLKLVVNGRKGRRVVVVLGSDRKHYRVLDMDFRKGGKRILDEGLAEGEGDSEEQGGEGEEDEDVEMGGA